MGAVPKPLIVTNQVVWAKAPQARFTLRMTSTRLALKASTRNPLQASQRVIGAQQSRKRNPTKAVPTMRPL
jgi:hypothetical protein